MKMDFVEEKDSYFFCSDGLFYRAENYFFSKDMVDHNQQRIKARRSREVNNKITGDLLKEV